MFMLYGLDLHVDLRGATVAFLHRRSELERCAVAARRAHEVREGPR